ncbi:unnamed protein product [Durusdinium trenchii]|uniref:Secreted protein n=1 Tax=Durusdinium trenchii TaxID=1381693 RepID=A0ABP0JWB1_9DINO
MVVWLAAAQVTFLFVVAPVCNECCHGHERVSVSSIMNLAKYMFIRPHRFGDKGFLRIAERCPHPRFGLFFHWQDSIDIFCTCLLKSDWTLALSIDTLNKLNYVLFVFLFCIFCALNLECLMLYIYI